MVREGSNQAEEFILVEKLGERVRSSGQKGKRVTVRRAT